MKDINLLFKEEKVGASEEAEQAQGNKAAVIAKTVTVLVIIVAFVAFTLVAPKIYVETLNARVAKLEQEIRAEKYQEIKTVNSQLDKVVREITSKQEIIDHIERQGNSASVIINTVKNNIPEGCIVNSIEFDGSRLRMSVKCEDIANIAEFLTNMGRIRNFSLSDSSRNLKINENGEYNFSFDIIKDPGLQEVQ